MALTFESMIRIESEVFVCRIWRSLSEDEIVASNALIKEWAIGDLRGLESGGQSMVDTIESIVGQSGVSAVEIIDRNTGCGLCCYKNWP